jgi:hypothetical protein
MQEENVQTPAGPSPKQKEEWRKSRHHDDDGTYRGCFGGAPEPAVEDKAVKGPREKK